MDPIPDPGKFFHELGGLHDAIIEWLCWDSASGVFRLTINNLNANFMDGDRPSADYPGYKARPATIVFLGVRNFTGNVGQDVGWIFSLEIERSTKGHKVKIAGTTTSAFVFECDSVALEGGGEPASVAAHYDMLKA
jgi:hypothetical protein